MFIKKINSYALLIFGTIFIFLGLLAIFTGNWIFKYVVLLAGVATVILSVIQIINFFSKRKKEIHLKIYPAFFSLFASIIIITFTDFVMASITFFLGIYILLHSFLHFLNLYIILKNNMPNKFKNLFMFLVTIVLGTLLVFKPTANRYYAYIVIGLYLIFLGISYYIDFYNETKSYQKNRKIRIMLPIVITAFIPQMMLPKFKKMVIENLDNFNKKKNNENPDIGVIFHFAEGGTAMMGHVEITYKNKIYSYGNYDRYSRIFFDTIGDGVLLEVNKKKYIKYAVTKKDRYIVEFGLKLTEKQKKLVEKRIEELYTTNTVPHFTDYDKSLIDPSIKEKIKVFDMSSDYSRYCEGKFWKITKGKLKKFFVFKTNCVSVVEYILRGTGNGIIAINGLITPGTYYTYLNNELTKKNGLVISRYLYTKKEYQKKGK